MNTDDKLTQLDRDIIEALRPLNSRQTKFVRELAKGNSQEKSALKAGYSPNTARAMSLRLLDSVGVRKAVDLVMHKDQLQHGIDIGVKRKLLLEIAETAMDKDGGGYQPRASVSALAELNRMDGHIKPTQSININSTSVDISYRLELPERGTVIDHQAKIEKKED